MKKLWECFENISHSFYLRADSRRVRMHTHTATVCEREKHALRISHRYFSFPIKNNAIVPGPEWAPMVGLT